MGVLSTDRVVSLMLRMYFSNKMSQILVRYFILYELILTYISQNNEYNDYFRLTKFFIICSQNA